MELIRSLLIKIKSEIVPRQVNIGIPKKAQANDIISEQNGNELNIGNAKKIIIAKLIIKENMIDKIILKDSFIQSN